MKRNEFITKILGAASLLLLPGKKTEALPLTACMYVEITVGIPTRKPVGCFTITPGQMKVRIQIFDTRINQWVLRDALDLNGTPILAGTAMTIPVTVTLP